MAKTKEELAELKEEYEDLVAKCKELTSEELSEVTGGADFNADFSPAITILGAIKEKLC